MAFNTSSSNPIKSSKENQVLRKGVNYSTWRSMLEGALLEKDCISHVFHDIDWSTPVEKPVRTEFESQTMFSERMKDFMKQDTKAYSIIMARLDESIRPDFGSTRPSAKDLIDTVEATYKPAITVDIHNTIRKLNGVKLNNGDVLKYCEDFTLRHRQFQIAVSQYSLAYNVRPSELTLPSKYINILFELGTTHVEWLRSWRHITRPETSTLEQMMTSLRREKVPAKPYQGFSTQRQGQANSATGKSKDNDDLCDQCTNLKHTNANCWAQHPEKAPEWWKPTEKKKGKDNQKKGQKDKKKGKGKGAVATQQDDEDDNEDAQSNSDRSDTGHISGAAVAASGSDGPDTETLSGHGTDIGFVSGAAIAGSGTKGITSNSIIYDSGTSFHFFNNKSWFRNLKPMAKATTFSQAVGRAKITHSGTIQIKLKFNGHSTNINLRNCLYSPDSHCNLVSAGRLEEFGGVTLGSKGTLRSKQKTIGHTKYIQHVRVLQDVTIRKGTAQDITRVIPDPGSILISAPAVASTKATTQRWHERLGHIGTKILTATRLKTVGLEGLDTSTLDHCDICHISKAQRVVSRDHRRTPNQPLDELHIDTVGPVDPPDLFGNRYIFFITDGRTRTRWPIMTPRKQGQSEIRNLTERLHRAYSKRPKLFFSDNGTEYKNLELIDWAKSDGIRWDFSAPYTPEQNGIAESTNKVILTRARSIMLDSGLPTSLWHFAVLYSCCITNRLANLTTKDIPLHQLEKELNAGPPEKVDLSNMKRFGCKAFIYNRGVKDAQKFAPRATTGWFVGFQENSTTNYLVWQPYWDHMKGVWSSYTTYSPHVTFHEDTVFGTQYQQQLSILPAPEVQGESIQTHEQTEIAPGAPPIDQGEPDTSTQIEDAVHTPEDQGEQPVQQQTPQQLTFEEEKPSQSEELEETTEQETTQGQDPLEYIPDNQNGQVSNKLEPQPQAQDLALDESTDVLMTPFNIQQVSGSKRKRSLSPQPRVTRSGRAMAPDYKKLHTGAAAMNQNSPEPATVDQALQGQLASHWKAAMRKEMKSLEETGTIEWIKASSIPRGRTPLTGKWVFKIKYLLDGTVEKYKARWTARGFAQKKGLDYTNTFAPTPRAPSGRVILALGVQHGWERTQIDVETAFLNPNLDREIFIKPPEGYQTLFSNKSNMLIKIKKGLYGLKQAANLWYHDAAGTMLEMGLKRTSSDACVFTGKGIIIVMHVDDFQIFAESKAKTEWFIKGMRRRYNIKVVDTNLFLGIHIIPLKKGEVKLSQKHYSKDKLQNHNLLESRTVKYPLDRLYEPSDTQCTQEEYHLFNQIIGELQHLSNHTRPDIAFSVNHLARFLQNPSQDHITGAKHIWKYIAGTLDYGITLRKMKKPAVEAYSDSDFSGDPSTSRSTSGTVIKVCDAPVIWRSQLQKEVVLSSTEAEYLALTETTREIRWLRNLLTELHPMNKLELTEVRTMVDNQSAISLVKNHSNSRRSRHVSLRNHYCREQHEKGLITVEYINTTEQLADSLTKPKSPVPIL